MKNATVTINRITGRKGNKTVLHCTLTTGTTTTNFIQVVCDSLSIKACRNLIMDNMPNVNTVIYGA